MKNKGLCSTCSNDKECSFARIFPVIQCEEFDGNEKTSQKIRKRKKSKKIYKREKTLTHA